MHAQSPFGMDSLFFMLHCQHAQGLFGPFAKVCTLYSCDITTLLPCTLFWCHPNRPVQANDFAIEHFITDDMLHQVRILAGFTEA